MRRRGHSRPVGTETTIRLRWHGDGEPLLGDYVCEGPEILVRGYRVVGIEETSSAEYQHRLILERITWGDFEDARERGERWWEFVRNR